MSDRLPLVPGRECGTCNACCIHMTVDQPDIQKDAGVICKHNDCGRCTIQATWPLVCRTFHCAWKRLPGLGPEWRPETSGVLISFDTVNGVTGLDATLLRDPFETVREPWFLDFVIRAVNDKATPLWLSLPPKRGYEGPQSFLNVTAMREAARANARDTVLTLLEQVVRNLQAFQCRERRLIHSGNNTAAA